MRVIANRNASAVGYNFDRSGRLPCNFVHGRGSIRGRGERCEGMPRVAIATAPSYSGKAARSDLRCTGRVPHVLDSSRLLLLF